MAARLLAWAVCTRRELPPNCECQVRAVGRDLPDWLPKPKIEIARSIRDPDAEPIGADLAVAASDVGREQRPLDGDRAVEVHETPDRALETAEHLGRAAIERGETTKAWSLGPHLFDHLRHEAGEPAAICHSPPLDECGRLLDQPRIWQPTRIGLYLELKREPGRLEDIKNLLQRRDRLVDRVLQPQPGESLQAVVRYGAAPIGCPLEERVVDDDDFTVLGEVQVELDGIDAERRRLAEAAETVLGPQVAASA